MEPDLPSMPARFRGLGSARLTLLLVPAGALFIISSFLVGGWVAADGKPAGPVSPAAPGADAPVGIATAGPGYAVAPPPITPVRQLTPDADVQITLSAQARNRGPRVNTGFPAMRKPAPAGQAPPAGQTARTPQQPPQN